MNNPKVRDSRSTADIVKEAYTENDEDKYWKLISTLHRRGGRTEFSVAEELILSADPINREMGADILGRLGWEKRSFHSESISLLIKLLSDSVNDVISSAAFSLGHRHAIEAVQELLKLIDHPNDRVRFGVALGLSCLEDESAIKGLIILSRDSDFDVRNWATFGLGSQCDMDTDILRRALKDRLDDPEPEIRGEALIGLAERKDDSVIGEVLRDLAGEFQGGWVIEAAEIYPHNKYIPLLSTLIDRVSDENKEYFSKQIKSALLACKAQKDDPVVVHTNQTGEQV